MAKTKTKPAVRTRMTDDQVKAYLKHYQKAHDFKPDEFKEAVQRCAATRWAALERNAKKAAPKAKPKAAKKAKKK